MPGMPTSASMESTHNDYRPDLGGMFVRMRSTATFLYWGVNRLPEVVPMLIETLTFGWIYRTFLGTNPTHAITFAGVLMVCAALATLRIRTKQAALGA